MQRLQPTSGEAMTLSQALGAGAHSTDATAVDMVAPMIPAVPTLAEERAATLEQARIEGLRVGEAAAAAALEKRLREQCNALQAAHDARLRTLDEQQRHLQELLAAVPACVDRLEAQLLEDAAVLAYAAVARVYGSANADFRQVCSQLLDEQRERPVLLRVAPSLHSLVEDLADAQVRVEPTAGLSPGQAQLQTHNGIVDGGLDVRLDAIRAAFLSGLAAQPR